jgi:two-component sensor histidine kinase
MPIKSTKIRIQNQFANIQSILNLSLSANSRGRNDFVRNCHYTPINKNGGDGKTLMAEL